MAKTANSANVARLKKVQAIAKQLKAKNKKLSHTEAVKAAWKQLKSGKVAGWKKGPTKMVEVGEKRPKKGKVVVVQRRKTTKAGTFKKFKRVSGVHKDTQSHNVRVSVVSGVGAMNNLNFLVKEKQQTLAKIEMLKKAALTKDAKAKAQAKQMLVKYRKYLASVNVQIREAKKHI